MAWEILTHNEHSLAHLGITATHIRRIKSGAEYEKYFTKANIPDELVKEEATVYDTLAFVKVLVNKTLNDTVKIAQVLKRPTLEATLKNIFDFFYQHYKYQLDELGKEQVRRPSRAWADRKKGIDCDCFTASVSSILTNLGIVHYLKIIAIDNKENFQHIYVVVPKTTNSDINSRAAYWVIDPVLNHFNEEAPNITKTQYLKMNGIPLYQLNGLDNMAGIGSEFDGIADELSGSDDQLDGRFKRSLLTHASRTRQKIQSDPRSVSTFYKPDVLISQYQKLESALSGSDDVLDGVLEQLSNEEHLAFQPGFQGVADAISSHDDHLYGHMFGNIDDAMLGTVLGLGRKGRAAKKVQAANAGKKGHFTKIKNARKALKSGKLKGKIKGAVKKISRVIKKTNPLAMAARAGMLVAMRTNFGKLAEKAYWGYQTREFAKSKGITDAYYDACVKLLAKIVKVYVERLGGDEKTIKKPIFNGRAAKKIAKSLKKKGMSGIEELYGLGGLGVVVAATSATTVTAAMAFLTPLIAFMKKSFAGKSDKTVKNENGTESDAPSDNAQDAYAETNSEASNPSDSTVDNDGSIEAADSLNNEDATDGTEGQKKKSRVAAPVNDSSSGKSVKSKTISDQKVSDDLVNPDSDQPEGVSKSNTGLMIGVGLVGIAAAAYALTQKNKKTKATGVNGLGNFSKKRETKSLQTKLKKQGVKLPHGYQVEKLKGKKIKTIKL